MTILPETIQVVIRAVIKREVRLDRLKEELVDSEHNWISDVVDGVRPYTNEANRSTTAGDTTQGGSQPSGVLNLGGVTDRSRLEADFVVDHARGKELMWRNGRHDYGRSAGFERLRTRQPSMSTATHILVASNIF
ncbi:hypothetical protein PGTUg99_000203 [Puccinia graminis f. sp. tritici]|uniref:Uncharacterized protein n=1 Tax=Puccinia graminis f. sp. tritici TaxID=56615 RepID=A0A5B0RVQ5_PUCGR|nr:hypothetical protein PGTUg99_000203 [Puccinia graminis f. sp. tritici]